MVYSMKSIGLTAQEDYENTAVKYSYNDFQIRYVYLIRALWRQAASNMAISITAMLNIQNSCKLFLLTEIAQMCIKMNGLWASTQQDILIVCSISHFKEQK